MYEAMFIFSSSLKDEDLEKVLDGVRGEIAKHEGKVKKTDVKGKRTFARTMMKRDTGLYVRIDFDLDPSQVDDLIGRYKMNESILRVQITKAIKRKEVAKKAEEEAVSNG